MPGRLDFRGQSIRVIDVFVDELDLGDLGFSGVDPEATGNPSVLLNLYIYGYLNRVQSSPRLERPKPPRFSRRLRLGVGSSISDAAFFDALVTPIPAAAMSRMAAAVGCQPITTAGAGGRATVHGTKGLLLKQRRRLQVPRFRSHDRGARVTPQEAWRQSHRQAAFAQIEFATDSPLEGRVTCELVSEVDFRSSQKIRFSEVFG